MSNEKSFGESYQDSIVKSLITSSRIYDRYGTDLIDPAYFRGEERRIILKWVKEYYSEYRTRISGQYLNHRLSECDNEFASSTRAILNKVLSVEMNENEIIDYTVGFCGQRAMMLGIIKCYDALNEGKEIDVFNTLYQAKSIVVGKQDKTIDYFSTNIDDLKFNTTVPTPWYGINKILYDGGVHEGELSVIMASTGVGKSITLVNLACFAQTQGFTVLYVTLEMQKYFVAMRMDAYFSQAKKGSKEAEAFKATKTGKGDGATIFLRWGAPKTVSVDMLYSIVKEAEVRSKKRIGLLIVDYADILKHSTNFNEQRFNYGNTYERLRGLAGELDIPVWSGCQANRSAVDRDIVTLDNISESFEKAMISDVIVALCQTKEQRQDGLAKFFIAKNRNGKAGDQMDVTINYNTYTIMDGGTNVNT